ncbi:MAG: hypothetical protein PVF65_08825 [Sphingomonadales bacterium]|jgi:arylesterase/paraoxonase
MSKSIVFTGLGAIFALGLSYGLIFADTAGVFRKLESVAPGPCVTLPGFLGPEDIVVDTDTGFAYITIADRHAVAEENGSPKGNIARIDLRTDVPKPIYLNPRPSDSFFPHGLDFHKDENGVKRLYVVNHWADETHHSIDSFIITDENTLKFERSFEDPIISSPNDVTAVEPGVFFTSNDMGALSPLGEILETYLMIPWSNIVYFNGTEARKVVKGLKYGNGVLYDSSNQRLYVAESTGQKVSAFHFDKQSKDLNLIWELDIPMSLDNLSMAPDGSLLVTGHPRIIEFLKHAKDPSLPASSEVVRITNLESTPTWETIYLNRGEEISAAPIAVEFEGRLFIGAVFDDHLLMCDLEK